MKVRLVIGMKPGRQLERSAWLDERREAEPRHVDGVAQRVLAQPLLTMRDLAASIGPSMQDPTRRPSVDGDAYFTDRAFEALQSFAERLRNARSRLELDLITAVRHQ